MKALLKTKAQAGLTLSTTEAPSITPQEVLIHITQASICGTDVHIYNWDQWAQQHIKPPLIIGHEFVGRIAKIGQEVKGLKIGQRVSAEGHIVCGRCRLCRFEQRQHLCPHTQGIGIGRNGAFAEFLSVPAFNVCPVPDTISDDIAALFDPLGNAVHTALAYDMIGEDVLITGAGPIGLMATAICRFIGARHIVLTDLHETRLKLGEKMGATRTVNVKQESLEKVMEELDLRDGFSRGLEMSGAKNGLHQMIKTLMPGGKIALLGLFSEEVSLPLNDLIFKGAHIKGIYGRKMFATWHKMLRLLQQGLDIKDIITHKFPLEDYEKAFDLLLKRKAIKVILQIA